MSFIGGLFGGGASGGGAAPTPPPVPSIPPPTLPAAPAPPPMFGQPSTPGSKPLPRSQQRTFLGRGMFPTDAYGGDATTPKTLLGQ